MFGFFVFIPLLVVPILPCSVDSTKWRSMVFMYNTMLSILDCCWNLKARTVTEEASFILINSGHFSVARIRTHLECDGHWLPGQLVGKTFLCIVHLCLFCSLTSVLKFKGVFYFQEVSTFSFVLPCFCFSLWHIFLLLFVLLNLSLRNFSSKN